MELNFQVPQEDEFAPCLMSLRSLYLGISFPRREDDYARYLDFRGVPQHEVDEWKSAFTGFLKKLTFKYDRPLVLKSPPHTARIRMLLEMFPDARFVHIHRHPYPSIQVVPSLLRHRHLVQLLAGTGYKLDRRPDHPPLHPAPRRVIRRNAN